MRTLNAPERAPDLVFEVDREHSGVRLLGCFLFLFGSIASYFVLSSLFSNGGLLAVGAALAIAVALTYLGDHLAKRYWPSNRVIQFADDMIQLLKSEQLQGTIHGGSTVNLLMWHFEAKRHPRVPKGWYVVANALEQDGEMIVSYSIASPTDFEALPLSRLSVKFQKKKRKKAKSKTCAKPAYSGVSPKQNSTAASWAQS